MQRACGQGIILSILLLLLPAFAAAKEGEMHPGWVDLLRARRIRESDLPSQLKKQTQDRRERVAKLAQEMLQEGK